jgi:glycosyltransferase involved in cell wall biosynthesis
VSLPCSIDVYHFRSGNTAYVRVLNHLELESQLERSGIGTAVRHQRAAMADTPIEVVTSPWNGGRPSKTALKRTVGDPLFGSYDLAHCNLMGPESLAVAAHARRNGIPLVVHAHTTAANFAESFRGSSAVAPVFGRYLRWFYSLADVVVCPSDHTRRTLTDAGVDGPISVVTNGVDIESLSGFETLRGTYRRRFDFEGLVVFSVGNVFERKGLTTFCRLAESTEHQFAWFGPYDTGPLASSVVRQRVSNPPQNATFTGWIDDIRGAYAAGDIYLFPTKNETQGIAALEAMACGKPVVIRDIPTFESLYTDGVDCLKCETLSEFRTALRRLAEDPSLRERLGENARKTASEHDLDRVAAELQDVYEQASAAGSDRPESTID